MKGLVFLLIPATLALSSCTRGLLLPPGRDRVDLRATAAPEGTIFRTLKRANLVSMGYRRPDLFFPSDNSNTTAPFEVIGRLPPGTLLRLEKLVYEWDSFRDEYQAYLTVSSGDFTGKRLRSTGLFRSPRRSAIELESGLVEIHQQPSSKISMTTTASGASR